MAPGPEVSGIDIYVRIKPVSRASNRLVIDTSENKIEFNIPRNEAAGLVNNQREHFEFRFNGILTAEAKQDEVFERVARPVVTGAMEGYNGTIFAYGQTGSGKTFTITGGPERYVDRGIIPRSISAIFTEISKRHDYQYTRWHLRAWPAYELKRYVCTTLRCAYLTSSGRCAVAPTKQWRRYKRRAPGDGSVSGPLVLSSTSTYLGHEWPMSFRTAWRPRWLPPQPPILSVVLPGHDTTSSRPPPFRPLLLLGPPQVHISYLEIYNNEGFDLLDAEREIKAMEDLQQVHLGEADDGTVSYRNLSMYRANNEEEALNLLFLGDTNRTISETPMNQASSRSHCIFTIHVEGRKTGEDVVRRSKLNLVDLAGSERVSKTGVDGTTLREAKYINLSLHYLEQVIIALQEKAMGMNRPHIPYRNSMMTMALKDSLGGNCRTTMVATVNSAQDQLDESISTCRFAQRVAMVRNTVLLNEELDPTLMIRRLKQEVRDLKEEIKLLKGEEEERGPLTPDEITRLQGTVESWVSDDSPDAVINLGGSMMMIRAVFDIFKRILRTGGFKPGAGGGVAFPKEVGSAPGTPAGGKGGGGGGEAGGDTSGMQEQIRKLKLQVAQRDNEIGILVSMLKRREAAGAKPAPVLGSPSASMAGPLNGGGAAGAAAGGPRAGPGPGGGPGTSGLARGADGAAGPGPGSVGDGGAMTPADEMAVLMNTNLLADRNKAFELFRKSYRQNEVIEENKALLKSKYDTAKSLGAVVSDAKDRLNGLKTAIERHRMQRAAAAVVEGREVDQMEEDEEEIRCKETMESEKARYKDAFGQLRELKKEIEHLHMLLEHSRTRLQRDFEQWMGLMLRQQQQQQQAGLSEEGVSSPANGRASSAGPPAAPRQAWGDPSASVSASQSGLRASSSGPAGASSSAGSVQWAKGALAGASPSTSQSFSASAGGGGLSSSYNYNPGTGPGPGAGAGGSSGPGMRGSGGWVGGGAGPGGSQGVDPAVLEAARPFLTGNADADADIIKFYEAKAKLLQKLGTS